jgi:Ca2+-binding RTX toxin-like protein
MRNYYGQDADAFARADSADAAGRSHHGAETLTGGAGADTLEGGAGNDLIIGKQGADLLLGGKGDDTIPWDPGDGSDVVDGGLGRDTMVFNTANIDERLALGAGADGHAILTRNVGNITMDLTSVERVVFGGATGGADSFTIGDLSDTDVRHVEIDLGNDGAADLVGVNGGAGRDRIFLAETADGVSIRGLAARIDVTHADAIDRISVNGGAGDDRIDASRLGDGVRLVLVGGEGDDRILGGAGGDTLAGGNGDDVLAGGAGGDRFVFNGAEAARDTIVDFHAHGVGAEADLIELSGFSDHSFDEAVANGHIVQAGADVLIASASGAIVTLHHVSLASLDASDFLFG